jgi:hypothetical protein
MKKAASPVMGPAAGRKWLANKKAQEVKNFFFST